MTNFSIGVGNTSDVYEHEECSYYEHGVKKCEVKTFKCEARARYVSLKKVGVGTHEGTMTICEFVVIGNPLRNGQGDTCITWHMIQFVLIDD